MNDLTNSSATNDVVVVEATQPSTTTSAISTPPPTPEPLEASASPVNLIPNIKGPIRHLINIDDLVDINTVVIDTSLPVEEKKRQYLEQIKNPYLYRCGDTIVRISHVDTGVSLAERLKQYLLSRQGMCLK